jgi:hypothetical protein
MSTDAVRAAIIRAAEEMGIDPRYALAVAGRETNFNTRAKNSKSIFGAFQMTGDNRARYGAGDSDDPYVQARAFGGLHHDNRKSMASVMGRDPTDEEAYLGHHFGARRAARMLIGDPERDVSEIFTPREMALNPHFGRAGTSGKLTSSVMSDIRARMGGGKQASSGFLASEFGEAIDAPAQPSGFSASEFGDVI